MGRNERVGGGIPGFNVDTILNSNDVARSLPQNPFKTIAIFLALLDLPRIGRTHGSDDVRIHDSDLHEVEHTVELEWTGRIELRIVETRTPHGFPRKEPLVAKIVNRVDGASVCERIRTAIEPSKVSWNKRRL